MNFIKTTRINYGCKIKIFLENYQPKYLPEKKKFLFYSYSGWTFSRLLTDEGGGGGGEEGAKKPLSLKFATHILQ